MFDLILLMSCFQFRHSAIIRQQEQDGISIPDSCTLKGGEAFGVRGYCYESADLISYHR